MISSGTPSVQHGYMERNLFAGVTIKQNRHRIQKGREDFTPEQVRTILEAVVDNSRWRQKALPEMGPLIGMYTGARSRTRLHRLILPTSSDRTALVFRPQRRRRRQTAKNEGFKA